MTDTSLAYGIEERPPSRWETVLYGWQHTLVDISPFVLTLAVAAAAGLSAADTARLINYGLFGTGLATLTGVVVLAIGLHVTLGPNRDARESVDPPSA